MMDSNVKNNAQSEQGEENVNTTDEQNDLPAEEITESDIQNDSAEKANENVNDAKEDGTELIAAKDKEIGELKDKYLRLAAEYDNFRKRSSKERDGIYTDAVSDTIKEILPVIDNLERASLYSDAQKVAEGLKLTAKGAAAMLSKLGITEFAKEGEHFDPNLHNAVMHVEDEDLGEGVIVEVFQKGYRRGDKIIRYAMVKVAN